MSWLRLDTSLAHHPRLRRCSPSACWFYVCCLAYTTQYRTDNFITSAAIPSLSHVRHPSKAIEELIAAGLLTPNSLASKASGEPGYFLRDLAHLDLTNPHKTTPLTGGGF